MAKRASGRSEKQGPGTAGPAVPDGLGPAPARPASQGYPIVGIGASAGGLEAFEQLFRALPPATGLAFVLVPHLDPSHASILGEILQRCTRMPVVEARDQMPVLPDRVYVIPPNRDMAVFHGTLQLSVPEAPRGQRMPIDAFLRSLAEDQGERAVGILLSGTGTDGTLGLRSILGAGGFTLVQDPASAKYGGMPSSAIQAGYASKVLTPDAMPAALLAGTRSLLGPVIAAEEQRPLPATAAVNKLLLLVRSATGHDFSLYKKSTIGRRIERRMAQHDIGEIEAYTRYLKENPTEVQALFRELLINVTSFFRDPEAFAALRKEVLPQLLADKQEDYCLRAWVAGCATGEEAYSIAILLRELMDEARQEFKVQLYATDLDEEAIAAARAGIYPPNVAADVTPDRLRRFFVKEEAGYRVKKEIREMVVFAIQNIIKDPPFTKLDLISCRNLMIYLEPELQARLVPSFHYALKPDGILFLSPSESTGSQTELFAPVSRKWKIYRAAPSKASLRAVMTGGLSWTADTGGAAGEAGKKAKEINFAELTRRVLLQSYAPASVVCDAGGNVLFVHGETGKYLRPAPGQATLSAVEMAREGLALELRAALQAAASHGTATLGRELAVRTNGDYQTISLSVRPLPDPDGGQSLLLVSFQEIARPQEKRSAAARRRGSASADARRIEELQRELAYSRENLQATIEEQQASNEELKSTNEELQSTNEELQSTNEELETSKEELQSVNEELITVNSELQAKIEQLASMQNDMKNLLDNISVGTIFLDGNLMIRRFTRDATNAFRLAGSDVGRPLADIKSNLEGEDLLARSQHVLDTLVPWRGEVRAASGRWYMANIQPYRTLDNVIEGVVLTFSDVTESTAAQASLREREAELLQAEKLARIGRWKLDHATQALTWSENTYRIFEALPSDFAPSFDAFLTRVHLADRDRVRHAFGDHLEQGRGLDVPYRVVFPDGRVKSLRATGRTDFDAAGAPLASFGIVQDISDLTRVEEELQASRAELKAQAASHAALLDALPVLVAQLGADGRFTYLNPAGTAFFGPDALGRAAAGFLARERNGAEPAFPRLDGSQDGLSLDVWQRRHDGAERLLSWCCRTLRDAEGRLSGTLAAIRDVTPAGS